MTLFVRAVCAREYLASFSAASLVLQPPVFPMFNVCAVVLNRRGALIVPACSGWNCCRSCSRPKPGARVVLGLPPALTV
jgi:hypothetical protein